MKHLEEVLKTCPKPELDVSEFETLLGREIHSRIQRKNQNGGRGWMIPLTLSAGIVLLLALLSLCILYPEVPEKINHWAGLSSVEYVPEPLIQASDSLKTVFSPESDKVYAQNWIRQNYPGMNSRVTGIEEEKIMALRWVKLDNGQKVLVLSEYDPRQPQKPKYRSFQNGGIL